MKHSKHHKSQMNIIAFQKKYNTEDKCRNFLFKCRFPKGFICPKCGCHECYFINTRKIYKCKKCRHQLSITSGTVMDRTHLKLTVWLWAMYLFTIDKRGCSANNLSRVLGVPYKTAWFILQRLRKAMENRDDKYLLDGVVELDDTYVGAPSKGGKRGRGSDKMKIEAALSKTPNGKPLYLKMKCLPNLKGITIGKFARENIKEGATIETDGAQAYKKTLAKSYMHVFEIFDADNKSLAWLHTMISNMKAFISGTYHGVERKHIDLYLAEFCFRFNRRYFFEKIYEHLAVAAMAAPVSRFVSFVGVTK